MKCAAHPDVETSLRCGKCNRPICPKCMVETPVGARCPECARLRKLPTFQVGTRYLLIAAGSGLATAALSGVIWGVINSFTGLFYLNLILAVGAGYIIGEVISITTNRKGGTKLVIIASLAVILSYLVSIAPPWGSFFNSVNITHLLLDLISIGLGIFWHPTGCASSLII